jgi:pyridoxal phosphate enzyme (YggS family)
VNDQAFGTRLAQVRERMARAAERSGRPAGAVRLVAATKTVPPEVLGAAVAAGIADLGENRVQEAAGKIPLVRPEPVAWHLIGSLQMNKVPKATTLFDCIQTVDSFRLAEKIHRVVSEGERSVMRPLRVLVEVNVSGEATKHGVAPGEAAELVAAIRGGCPGLALVGLMTVGPLVARAEEARPAYRALARLADDLALPERSMGMSGDYEIAIEEGATMVRLGSALFGARPTVAAVRPADGPGKD